MNTGPSLTGLERLTPDPGGQREEQKAGRRGPRPGTRGGPRGNAAWGMGAESRGSPQGRSPPGGRASSGPLAVTAGRARVRRKVSSRIALTRSPDDSHHIKAQP